MKSRFNFELSSECAPKFSKLQTGSVAFPVQIEAGNIHLEYSIRSLGTELAIGARDLLQ